MRTIKNLLPLLWICCSLSLRAQVPAADNLTGSANSNMNWTITTSFDASGNVQTQSKKFYDNSGKLLQAQSKVFYRSNPSTVYTHVFAAQPIRDVYGRGVLTTMAAPIDYADFSYQSGFVPASGGGSYSYKNFDRFNPSGTETDLTNSPQGIGGQSTKGTLGWYFGSSNTWEPYTPTTNFPYSRSTVYRDGTNLSKKDAGNGEAFVMGSNHEQSGCSTPVSNELTNYFSVRNRFFTAAQMGATPSALTNGATQTVTKDPNGREGISISDTYGNVLVTGRPGTDLSFTNYVSVAAPPTINYTQQVVCTPGNSFMIQVLEGGGNMNIYLISTGTLTSLYTGSATGVPINTVIGGAGTMVIQSDVSFYVVYANGTSQFSTPSSLITGGTVPTVGYFKILADNTSVSINGNYTLYDMNTEAVTSPTMGQLNHGFYKLIANSGFANAYYNNGYTDVTYYFYNGLQQLVAMVPPNGVKLLEGTGYMNYATLASIPYVKLYSYDARGNLVGATTPESGTGHALYRTDGKIRFSQNALQATAGSYSYTNYDALGRVIESGQYDATGIPFNSAAMTAILDNTSSTGGIGTGTKTDVVAVAYDVPDNTHGQSGYVQDPVFLGGAVSTTTKYSSVVNNAPSPANMISKTWYNYDEGGKIIWKIKYIPFLGAVGYKTTDYTYDALNRLVKIVFQKNTAAETFVHYFQYDAANGNLLYVYTNTVDNPATETLQAKYIYYLHGPLKRVEFATNLQGLDYTYTLQGALKAINNSNSSADPGNDATATNGFSPDAFGEVLDYYANDYNNSRTTGIQPINGVNTSAITSDSYVGNIKAMSWYSLKPVGSGGSASPTTYVYNYDPKYQYIAGTWGTPSFGTTPATFTPGTQNQETVTVPGTGTPGTPAYDANGNILNMQRTGTTGAVTDKFAYTYTPNTNMVSGIANSGTPSGTFTYGYDALGRETSENTGSAIKYTKYDLSGRVIMVAADAAFSHPIVSYVYDEMGDKIEKVSYNGSWQPSLVTYYYGSVIFTQVVTGGTSYGTLTPQEYTVMGGSGRLGTFFKQSGSFVYELDDHLGNVRALIAKTGSIQTTQDYYPFGLSIATLGTAPRYGYQGQFSESDPESGWNNFELRMYNPRMGRWMAVDPKQEFSSPYEAMGNDPIRTADPDGGSTYDWFAHQNADGTISLFYDSQNHDAFLYQEDAAEMMVNVGENNISQQQALANATAYFSGPPMMPYPGNFHNSPFDPGYFAEQAAYADPSVYSSVPRQGQGQADNEDGFNWWSATNLGLTGGEAARQASVFAIYGKRAEVIEKALDKGKFILNGKTYSQLFRGNQYVSSELVTETLNGAKFAKNLGRGLTVVTAVVAVTQFAVSKHTGEDWARLGGAAVITASAFIPVVGPFISIGLGVLDSFGAFDGIYKMFK